MAHLSSGELNKYKKLHVSDIKTGDGIGKRLLERLRLSEKNLHKKAYGLPFFVASEHHLHELSLNEIAKRLNLYPRDLSAMLSYYKIPYLSRYEAVREMLYERWKDPEFRERNAKAVREMLYERWKDPEFRDEHAKAVREKWKDPEFRERNAKAVREMLYERWKDPEFRDEHAKAVRERHYGAPIKKDDVVRILRLYDKFANSSETYEDVIKAISKRTQIKYAHVKAFLNRYFST
jgi:hypothetical protein